LEEPNTIKVRQTRQVVEREEIKKAPKSDKSLRVLVMPSFVARELKRIKEDSIINIKHKLVCCESAGEPLSINTFARRFDRALKKASLPKAIRYHDLRHTCAALMTLAGATPKEVSEYLGHASIAITMDLYADVFDTSKAATAQKLDALMSDQKPKKKAKRAEK
jgi:integrase